MVLPQPLQVSKVLRGATASMILLLVNTQTPEGAYVVVSRSQISLTFLLYNKTQNTARPLSSYAVFAPVYI